LLCGAFEGFRREIWPKTGPIFTNFFFARLAHALLLLSFVLCMFGRYASPPPGGAIFLQCRLDVEKLTFKSTWKSPWILGNFTEVW
jgi:hypothetical protein